MTGDLPRREAAAALHEAVERPLSWGAAMSRYVHPTEQLVTEIVVRSMKLSVEFYRSLGFKLLRDGGDFVELTWEGHRLFLAELSAFHEVDQVGLAAPPQFPVANVRVMVANVDDYWRVANEIGARTVVPIANRYYGLRDFTIADPDGFGVRFASALRQPSNARFGRSPACQGNANSE